MRPLFWSLLVASVCGFARAEPANAVHAEIVPPPLDGRVSLGVFAPDGKCVRVLFKNVEQEKIPSALNGWALSWDGKTENGETAAPGNYEIRGVVLGTVKIAGLAWHFNDWIDPDHAENAPSRTVNAALISGGGFLLMQRDYHGAFQLNRFSDNGQLVWSKPLTLEPKFMAVVDASIFLADGEKLQKIALEDGMLAEESAQKVSSLASNSSTLFFTREQELLTLAGPGEAVQTVATFPFPIRTLAAADDVVFASDGQKIYLQKDGQNQEIPVPQGEEVLALAGANADSFWAIVRGASGTSLKCFGSNGGLIRELPAEDHLAPVQASVSTDQTTILEIGVNGPNERVRLLKKVDAEASAQTAETVSFWKPVLQREIVAADHFGFDANGKLIPETNVEPKSSQEISLVENPLQPGVAQTLKIKARSGEDGVWIFTQSGLPLFPITRGIPSSRLALLSSPKRGDARLFISLARAVSEFQITGLENIMTCRSGPLQWPPGPAQSPDEEHVPTAKAE